MGGPENRGAEKLFDVIVIGGGPAGLTAALYLARAKYRVLLMEKEQFGGQITITHEVVNYPGVGKASGRELSETMRRQAESFGAEFLSAEAVGLDLKGDIKTVHTSSGDYRCFGVLLATGAVPRTVGFAGEEEYRGRGVAYCATCDGEFFSGKEVFVIGGGYASAEESVFLTRFARHVTILIRGKDFSCAASLAEKAKNHEKITVLTNTVVEEVSGKDHLTYIRYKNTVSGEVTEYRAKEGENFGVFVLAGYKPASGLVKGIAALNEQGYVITDAEQKTSADGLYAAGDVCIKPLRQVVTATSDGALAAAALEKYAAQMQQKTGLHPASPAPHAPKAAAAPPPAASPANSDELFSPEMKAQLNTVFARMEQALLLKLYLDDRPVSAGLKRYITALAALSDKLHVETADSHAASEIAPCVKICLTDGTETGLAFHGIPGGHEFTSFVLGLYNAAGPGQEMNSEIRREIASFEKPVEIMVLVTLSCALCPDLVTAVQHIAAQNPNVTAEIYDIQHFPELQRRYHVMSVPCLVLNGETPTFGKKNLRQVLDMIKAI